MMGLGLQSGTSWRVSKHLSLHVRLGGICCLLSTASRHIQMLRYPNVLSTDGLWAVPLLPGVASSFRDGL
jgi:hypothetical protein